MNDYEILSLLETFAELKKEGIKGVPNSFTEFLRGVVPTEPTPQVAPSNRDALLI